MNYRGQQLDFVKYNKEINDIYESIFRDYIKDVFNIDIIKHKDYKHYDFMFNKIHKIEYKGVYYSIDEKNKIAIKHDDKTKKIDSVYIGVDKITYYYYRQIRNPELKFYIYYGFYDINSSNEIYNIKYRYIDISDILKDIIMTYKKCIYLNKKHFLIPIKDLKKINKNKSLFND